MRGIRIAVRPVWILDIMIYFTLGVLLCLFFVSDIPGVIAGWGFEQGKRVWDAVGPLVVFLFPQSILVVRHFVMALIKTWESWAHGLNASDIQEIGMRRMAARRIKKRATKYGTMGTVFALIYFFTIQDVDLTKATAEIFPVLLNALGSALITTLWGLLNWILADLFDDLLCMIHKNHEGGTP